MLAGMDSGAVSGSSSNAPDAAKRVRLLYAAFNNYDVGGVVAMMHPEVELVLADENGDPVEGGERRGREAVREYCEEIRVALHAPTIRAKALHDSENRVVAEVEIHGTQPGSDHDVVIPAVQFFGFDEGLVRWFRTHRAALDRPPPAA